MSWVRVPPEAAHFSLEKWLPWVCCVALSHCLFDLACFFLPFFSSLIKICTCKNKMNVVIRLSGGSSLLCPANLSDESVGLHSAVGVHLRHVHVINEVDQSLGAGRAEAAARLLLQRRLHHLL